MSARKPKAAAPVTAAGVRKDLVRLLRENAHARHMWEVWRDFIEMAAIAISNSVDVHQREEREARYLAIAGRYTREQLDRFGAALGALTCALEEEPTDVLGETYMELEITWTCHAWRGNSSALSRDLERIWFSPHCLPVGKQRDLWEAA